jgi:hypothetical protein
VMRKLSMVSIASNFSRRPSSRTSVRLEDDHTSSSGQSYRTAQLVNKPIDSHRPPLMVDFHKTPSAFLPEDFGLGFKPARRPRKLQRRMPLRGPVVQLVPLQGIASQKGYSPSKASERPTSARSNPPLRGPELVQEMLPASLPNGSLKRSSETDHRAPSPRDSFTKGPTKSRSRLFKIFGST